jgi:hypothetical protein
VQLKDQAKHMRQPQMHNQGASWQKLLKKQGGEIYLPLASSVGATRQLQRALVQTSHDKIRENTTYQSPGHFPLDFYRLMV